MFHKLTALIIVNLLLQDQPSTKLLFCLINNLNKNFIATSLCENRDKPKCCCQGKCLFKKKQLQKDEPGKSTSSAAKEKVDFRLFCEENIINYTAAFLNVTACSGIIRKSNMLLYYLLFFIRREKHSYNSD